MEQKSCKKCEEARQECDVLKDKLDVAKKGLVEIAGCHNGHPLVESLAGRAQKTLNEIK